MLFHRVSNSTSCMRYRLTASGDQSGVQVAGRSRRGISSVESGCSTARQLQKSFARSSNGSAPNRGVTEKKTRSATIRRELMVLMFSGEQHTPRSIPSGRALLGGFGVLQCVVQSLAAADVAI